MGRMEVLKQEHTFTVDSGQLLKRGAEMISLVWLVGLGVH